MMRRLLTQLVQIVKRATLRQKLLGGSLLLLALLSLGLFASRQRGHFVPLYPHLTAQKQQEAIALLQEMQIPYKKKRGLLVPQKQLQGIRAKLSAPLEMEEKKEGFELFDTNTWIKGEKELQVLEMRALKGQLEKDLTAFENIKSASVILDLAPARAFGATTKTKASVILTLRSGAHLRSSQLQAITYHLASAVRGLEPENVAISDTRGRLYQAEGKSTLILEEELADQIQSFCDKFLGQNHYHLTCKVAENIAFISLLVDEMALARVGKGEIQKQMEIIAKGFSLSLEMEVDELFSPKEELVVTEKKTQGKLAMLFFLTLFLSTTVFLYILRRKKKPPPAALSEVDVHKLASSMKGEDPKTIARMISYLEIGAAEKMLEAFPTSLQEEILTYLENE